MSKVIQCDFCNKIFEKNNRGCIELYKKNSGNELISTGKHMCPVCYERFIGDKMEKKITNFEKITKDKESLKDFLFGCDVECSCCIYMDKEDCYQTNCVTGCETWLESEVEE